jgi:hypothetical protein
MPLVFCDANFIVTAHQGSDEYKQHLRKLGVAGTVTFVLSPMHWVEAAEDNDAARGAAKADFMDSLNAQWLFERRNVQGKEVATSFFRFLQVPCTTPQMIGPVIDVIADLAGVAAQRNSRDFVAHLRGIGADHPLERSLRQAFESNQVNGQRFRAGQLTPDFLRHMDQVYVRQLLPAETPGGVLIDEVSKQRFVDGCQLTDFPAFAVETRATHDSWRQARHMSRNNFMDQQHLMALPYVEYFVTNDNALRALAGRISAGLPFPVATVVSMGRRNTFLKFTRRSLKT